MTATDCATAVETFLKAQDFTQDVEVVRADIPKFDRKRAKAADPWKLTVWKGKPETAILGRRQFQDTYPIEIGIQKVVDAADQDEVDAATDFVEEVRNKFFPGMLGTDGPTITGLDVLQAFQTDDMNQSDVFLGVVTITFTVTR